MTPRRVLLAVGGLLTALLVFTGTANVVAVAAEQSDTALLEVDVAGLERVRIEADGPVVLRGVDRPQDARLEQTSQWAFRRPTVETERQGDLLVVRTDCWDGPLRACRVALGVSVPRGVDVDVRTSGGGVVVEDLEGTVDVTAGGGGVTGRRLAGDSTLRAHGGGVRVESSSGALELDSRGGGVRGTDLSSPRVAAESRGGGVDLSFADPPDDVRVDSRGGGVDVLLPDTAQGYDVTTDVQGGGTTVGVVDDPRSPRVVEVSSRGGDVRVAPAR